MQPSTLPHALNRDRRAAFADAGVRNPAGAVGGSEILPVIAFLLICNWHEH
jgi:hypothetical protein